MDLAGGFEVVSGATLTIQTGNDHGLVKRRCGIMARCNGRRPAAYQAGTNTVINESDGAWNVTGPDLTVTGGAQAFTNAGLLRKTAVAQLVIGATFTNTGTIDVDAGELRMAGGQLVNSGTIDVASGATLNAPPES